MITALQPVVHSRHAAPDALVVYTDGSAQHSTPNLRRPDTAGWAFVAVSADTIVRSGAGLVTSAVSSGRAELQGVVEGVLACREHARLRVVCDSLDIVQKALLLQASGRIPKHRKDKDLWTALRQLLAATTVEFAWIRGHGDDPFHNEADRLSRAACRPAAWRPRGA